MIRFALPLLVLSALSCQQPAASTDVKTTVKQEMNDASQLLQQERSISEKMHTISDKVENLPEKFKAEQADTYARLSKQANDVLIKRDHTLNLLQEGIGQSEQMLKASSNDVKQQFENEVQPKLKDAKESVKRYNDYLDRINTQLDSIAKAYGG
ncbi:MAG TPA: hypothetical protein PK971_04265 [Saprospiraceae bacterium]|nr:hypothetical protein [Saprospiraceae bacterium]